MSNSSCLKTSKVGIAFNEYMPQNVDQWSSMPTTHHNSINTIRPTLMASIIPSIIPSVRVESIQTMANTTMWSPINNTSYGFFSPRYSQTVFNANNNSIHANSCCLKNHNQRIHCSQYDNNWPNHENMNNCLLNNTYDSLNTSQIIESVDNEVNTDDSENTSPNVSERNGFQQMSSNSKAIKPEENLETKQLKGINEMLKSSLEQTNNKLKETQNCLLKMNEKLAVDYIDKYRINLKKYGDYIREECNRFYQNESIAKKLEPIVEQLTQASIKAKEEKERIRDTMAATQLILKEEINANFDVMPFDYNCLPEFPDLLSFYKSILDEIPLVFLSDLSQLKKFANKYIQTKKQSDVDQSLPNGSTFAELNSFQTVSKPLFSAPNISDLPKPDFTLFGIKEDKFNYNLRSNEDNASHSAMELSFPKSGSVLTTSLTSFNHLSNGITSSVEPKASTPKSNENQIPPIGQPLQTQPIIESLNNCVSNSKSTFGANGETIVPNVSESVTHSSITKTTNTAFNQNSLVNSASNALKLSQSQSKLLAKLKEKYTHLSEDLLINSITQTKSSLIDCGHSKGFSGMKVSDIIQKISEFIDENIISVNNTLKNRNPKPMPSLKLISTTDENISEQIMPKVWANQMSRKPAKNDDNCCSICFESISLVTKYETECHHFFHNSCISNWIKNDGSCPICRGLVLPPGEYPQL